MTERVTEKPIRAWQRMLSGRRLDLLNPHVADIEIEDIAHGLARVARWNGQTMGEHALSVAQHALMVEMIMGQIADDPDPRWLMAALLHDAAEYVIGDLISPFKTAIGIDYKSFELNLMKAIHLRFGLPIELPDHILITLKRADRISAYFEATVLAGFSVSEAEQFFGLPKGLAPKALLALDSLTPLPAQIVQRDFLQRYSELTCLVGGRKI
jgi:uncharacterized protein